MSERFRRFGVYEGPGRDWSDDERLDLMDAVGSWGGNLYVWCLLAWDSSYRPLTKERLRQWGDAAAQARRSGLTLWAALHPGDGRYCRHPSDRAAFIANCQHLIREGAEGICLFMDDTHGNGTISLEDAPHHARLVREVADAVGVRLAAVCGEKYDGADMAANPYTELLLEAVPRETMLVWTGPRIWNRTLSAADVPDLPRPVLLFDNFFAADTKDPSEVRDRVVHPYQGRDAALAAKVSAVVINPNFHYPWNICSVHTAMDYFRDPGRYDPETSFRAAVMELGDRYWEARSGCVRRGSRPSPPS